MDIADIKKVFQDNSVPLSKDDAWQVQKVWVMKHKALERLAAALKIKWDIPTIVRAQADEAVILVSACLEGKDDFKEWSIGEARVVPMVPSGRKNNYGKDIMEPSEGAIGNYQVTPKQASYVFAMAEKRAKDRVIIKLAGLHGAYSEEEADDFKQRNATAETATATDAPAANDTSGDNNPAADAPAAGSEPAGDASASDNKAAIAEIKGKIDECNSVDEVTKYMNSDATRKKMEHFSPEELLEIRLHGQTRLKALGWPGKKSAEKQAA